MTTIIKEDLSLDDTDLIFYRTRGRSFGSFALFANGKRYFVAMDMDNETVTSVDLIEPKAWLDMARNDENIREKIGGGRWELQYFSQ